MMDRKSEHYLMTTERAEEIARAAGVSAAYVREVCLADWPEGDEHQQWLDTAPAREIASWVQDGAADAGIVLWPTELLETPSDWGETVIGSRKGMEAYLADVRRDLGEDFEHCVSEDCLVLDFVRPLDATTALYSGGWHHDGYHRNSRRYGVAIRRTGPDATDYLRIAEWDTPDHCDYEPETEETP